MAGREGWIALKPGNQDAQGRCARPEGRLDSSATRSTTISTHIWAMAVRDCPGGVRRLMHLAHLRGLVTFEDSRAESA